MKANELRIGNLVNYLDKTVIIKGTSDGINNDGHIWFNDTYGLTSVHLFEPIELTEEWLIKLGFRRFVKDFSKNGIVIHTRKRGYVLRKSVPDILHVHQLQNLFYCLTGEELTLIES